MQETENSGLHLVTLEDRKSLSISGITDIDRFDEREN